MRTAVILGAGKGTKCWPYASVRPKVMIPVANRPIIDFNVQILLQQAEIERVVIAAGELDGQIRDWFRGESRVEVVALGDTGGTADTLLRLRDHVDPRGSFIVLYGDTILTEEDIRQLLVTGKESRVSAALVGKQENSSLDFPACGIDGGEIVRIIGHPRESMTRRFWGFLLDSSVFPYLERNPGYFTALDVGMMPPRESFLEMSLALYLRDGNAIKAVETRGQCFDIDRPWDILSANSFYVDRFCREAAGGGGSIDPTAVIEGSVVLGEGSRIGRNVIIRGNCICGKNSVIDNGAVIQGSCIIGDDCRIENYCQISRGTSIGSGSKVLHCAELEGLIMEGVYLYHYMEICGVVGRNTDLGAATVCGTLRFDDGNSVHRVKGRREYPESCANAAYIGDYCRTGVNVSIMPGKKMGAYSIAGPGVVLREDLPEGTLVQVKQSLEYTPWGPEKYGW